MSGEPAHFTAVARLAVLYPEQVRAAAEAVGAFSQPFRGCRHAIINHPDHSMPVLVRLFYGQADPCNARPCCKRQGSSTFGGA